MYIHKATVSRTFLRWYKWTDFYGVLHKSPTLPTELDVVHPALVTPLTVYATVCKEPPNDEYTAAVLKDLDEYHHSLELAREELQTNWRDRWDGAEITLTAIACLLLEVELTQPYVKELLQDKRAGKRCQQNLIEGAIEPLNLDYLLTIYGN